MISRTPRYGRITGSDDDDAEGSWLVALDLDGTPIDAFPLIPLETLPDVVPVWTIRLRWGEDPEASFSDDEAVRMAVMKMRRSVGEGEIP